MSSTYDGLNESQLLKRRDDLQKHIDYINKKIGSLDIREGAKPQAAKKSEDPGFLTNVYQSVTAAITPSPASKTVNVKAAKVSSSEPADDGKAAKAAAKEAKEAAKEREKEAERAAKEREKEAERAAKEREKVLKAAAKEAEKAAKEAAKEAEKRSLTEEREANRAREQAAREAQKRAAAAATPAKKGVIVEYDDGLARTSARKIKATKPVIIAVLRKNGVECSEKDNVPRLSALAEHHNLIRKCEDEQAKLDK